MNKVNNGKGVNPEGKQSCCGCIILIAFAFFMMWAIASLFAETPEEAEARKIKEKKELVIEWAQKQRTDFSFQGASTFLDSKQFDCFMDRDLYYVPKDYEKLIRLFKEGTIDEKKFKHEIKYHFERQWEKVYLQCGKIK